MSAGRSSSSRQPGVRRRRTRAAKSRPPWSEGSARPSPGGAVRGPVMPVVLCRWNKPLILPVPARCARATSRERLDLDQRPTDCWVGSGKSPRLPLSLNGPRSVDAIPLKHGLHQRLTNSALAWVVAASGKGSGFADGWHRLAGRCAPPNGSPSARTSGSRLPAHTQEGPPCESEGLTCLLKFLVPPR